MVHYIRYLRTPQVTLVPRKGLVVSAVTTVATDLGDAYFGASIELIVRLVDATNSGEVLQVQTVQWQDGLRAAKINLQCSSKLSMRLVRLHITSRVTLAALESQTVPDVLDVWSENFTLKEGAHTEAVVERQLVLPGKCTVRIWEETGDSIARHIWDASLGFMILLRQIFFDQDSNRLSSLQQLLASQLTTRIKVLEVGAGCGIVGIALAQLRKSDMLLTDLNDAQAILQSNVDCTTLLAGSTIHHQVLEWGPSIDTLSNPKYDLILVSDCIYNPDSSVLLVETLDQLSNHNPDLIVLVGFKRRHDADDIFFERMAQSGFIVAESCDVPLPHTMTDYDEVKPKVEMSVYRRT